MSPQDKQELFCLMVFIIITGVMLAVLCGELY